MNISPATRRTATSQSKNGDLTLERRLGRVENELEHQRTKISQHAATLKQMLADRRSTEQRFEKLERDLSQISKVTKEPVKTLNEILGNLALRVKSLENRLPEPETKPPRRVNLRTGENSSGRSGRTNSEERDQSDNGSSFLDSLF
jgi:hypothetical protein